MLTRQSFRTFLEAHSAGLLRYIMPDADLEFNEATRYPKLRNLSKLQWQKCIDSGREVSVTKSMLRLISNSTATSKADATESLDSLSPKKRKRVSAAIETGIIEYPIVVKDGQKLDLLSGNTRLTTLVSKGQLPKIWLIDISEINK